MRIKVLLTGNNKALINEFFIHTSNQLENMSSSGIEEDILCHMNYFKPDVWVYCLRGETPEQLRTVRRIKAERKMNPVPFIVIGENEECDAFIREYGEIADLILRRPISIQQIERTITTLYDTSNKNEEKSAAAQVDSDWDIDFSMPGQETGKSAGEDTLAMFEMLLNGGKQEDNRRRHILIVDDDSATLKLLKGYLSENYDVATAINGKIALKFLENKTTDLILLDYEMPYQNGSEVLDLLRENEKTKNIPVVFLTGMTQKDKIAEVLLKKPQAYLLKPIDMKRLSETIKSLIG